MSLVLSEQGEPKYIFPRSVISKAIKFPNQSFRLSYGRVVPDNGLLIIIYALQDNPNDIEFTAFGHAVKMTADATLRIALSKKGEFERMYAGQLGRVEIDGVRLEPSKDLFPTMVSESVLVNEVPAAGATPAETSSETEGSAQMLTPAPATREGESSGASSTSETTGPKEETLKSTVEDSSLEHTASSSTSETTSEGASSSTSKPAPGSTGSPEVSGSASTTSISSDTAAGTAGEATTAASSTSESLSSASQSRAASSTSGERDASSMLVGPEAPEASTSTSVTPVVVGPLTPSPQPRTGETIDSANPNMREAPFIWPMCVVLDVSGPAIAKTPSGKTVRLRAGQTLAQGVEITTLEDSRARLCLTPGGFVELGPESVAYLGVVRYSIPDATNHISNTLQSILYLSKGTATFNCFSERKGVNVFVHLLTPHGVASAQNTTFAATVTNSNTVFNVVEGALMVIDNPSLTEKTTQDNFSIVKPDQRQVLAQVGPKEIIRPTSAPSRLIDRPALQSIMQFLAGRDDLLSRYRRTQWKNSPSDLDDQIGLRIDNHILYLPGYIQRAVLDRTDEAFDEINRGL